MRLIPAAFAAITLSAGVAGAATLVDFTDRSNWNGYSPAAEGPVNYSGFTVRLASDPVGHVNFLEDYDGDASPCVSGGGDLACDSDGAGVIDDEVSISGYTQKLTVFFENGAGVEQLVNISGLQFLDFFMNGGTGEIESAFVSVNGGPAIELFATEVYAPGGAGHFSQGVSWNNVTSLTLWAGDNDGLANADFALAALEAQAIPLPAAAWLLGAGAVGLGFVGRRRRAA